MEQQFILAEQYRNQAEELRAKLNALQERTSQAENLAEQTRRDILNQQELIDKQFEIGVRMTDNPYFGFPSNEWPKEYHQRHVSFRRTLEKIKSLWRSQPLSCFVSYAWGSKQKDNYETEVQLLVEYLRLAGFDVPFDRDNLPGKEPTPKFIQHIDETDFVVICGTKLMMEKYRWKPKTIEETQPVVKTELDHIESLITKNEIHQKRMRPLVLDGTADQCLPSLLYSYVYFSFQHLNYFEILFGLIQSMYDIPNGTPEWESLKLDFFNTIKIVKQIEVRH